MRLATAGRAGAPPLFAMNIDHAIETIEGVIARLEILRLNKEARTVEDITSLLLDPESALRGAVDTLRGQGNGKAASYSLSFNPPVMRSKSQES